MSHYTHEFWMTIDDQIVIVLSNKSVKRRCVDAQIQQIKGADDVDIGRLGRLRGLVSDAGGDTIFGNIDAAEVADGLLNSGVGFDDGGNYMGSFEHNIGSVSQLLVGDDSEIALLGSCGCV